MVWTLLSNAGCGGSSHGQGTKIPHALGPKKQNIKKEKQNCNKFNKGFKSGPHQTIFKKKLKLQGNQSVQFSHSVMSDSLRPHGLQHARLPCPSPIPGVCSNSCPLSQWCHPTISIWKQLKCTSTDEWIKKMCVCVYIYTYNELLVIKKDKNLQQHGWTCRLLCL